MKPRGGSGVFSRGQIFKNIFENLVELFLGRPNGYSELSQNTKKHFVKLSALQVKVWKQAKKSLRGGVRTYAPTPKSAPVKAISLR